MWEAGNFAAVAEKILESGELVVERAGVEPGMALLDVACGTGNATLPAARAGARVTGLDFAPGLLEIARERAADAMLEIDFVEGDAQELPFEDASFDLVFSEYGASIWCDPYKWIPEAARLLRPGGELVFLRNSTLCVLCAPDDPDGKVGDRLLRPQFGMHRMEWSGEDEGIDFQLAHGDWIRLLRENGFDVQALWELQAPESAETHSYYGFVSAEWARQWPAEEIWKARKRG